MTVHHTCVINPPSPHRNTWTVSCSRNDLNRSYLNRVEAIEASWGHIKEVTLAASLESGNYQFNGE